MKVTSDRYSKDLKFVVSGGLGDCLLATPFLRHLARTGNYRRVVCVVPQGAVELFDRNPCVDQLVPCTGRDLFLWALPERNADVFAPYLQVEPLAALGDNMKLRARPLHCPNPSGIPVLKQLADHFRMYPDSYALDVYTDKADAQWAEDQVALFKNQPFVVINRESTYAQKTYPDSLWQKVVDLLHPEFVVLELARRRTPLKRVHPVTPLPGIRSSAELLRRAECVVTVDSFPGHLAHAVATPAVVLFGPANPKVFGHGTNRNLRGSVCDPCADTERRSACTNNVCMQAISPEIVVQAVRECVGSSVQPKIRLHQVAVPGVCSNPLSSSWLPR